jgi:hypothetical protein
MSKQINTFLDFLCYISGGKYWAMWYDVVCDYVCAKHNNKALILGFYTIFYVAEYLLLQILIKHLFAIKR